MKKASFITLLSLFAIVCQTSAQVSEKFMWLSDVKDEKPDTYAGFRGKFSIDKDTSIELRLLGASWYVVWLDGNYFYEGPDRYTSAYPEYQSKKIDLKKGKHILAIEVHYEGLETRLLMDIHPFLFCKLLQNQQELPVDWRCATLTGYTNKAFRINGQLGWAEWLDTRQAQDQWQQRDFNDGQWKMPVYIKPAIGALNPSAIGNVQAITISPKVIGEGSVAEIFGYERDNASARFFLSDLECRKIPAQGVWKRYDLGRVRLFRPKFLMDLPEGAIVEFAYSEYLTHGRVQPWITLSASDSYNLDHIVAKGGDQEFFPLTPKGGRFVEIHVFAPKDKITFIDEKFIERSYYNETEGSFKSNDNLIDLIWKTGIETLKACAEDAIIDNPTRERGQWLGDGGIVGMQIANVGFSDLRVNKRGLMQSAQCAREDGLVSGLFPGGGAHLSTYAAHWVPATINYWRFTGDQKILEQLFPAAEKNMSAFEKQLTEQGVKNELGWGFVDWGYISNEGPCDMAVNLHYYLALQDMIKWSNALNKKDKALKYIQLSQKMSAILNKWFQGIATADGYQWDKLGYHRAVLGISAGFIPKEKRKAAIEFIKKHILNCFPNNYSAPRLSDPNANNPQLITPYFANYAFPVLIENGEMNFVMDQYRRCWGWALEDGRTTWLEVFDTRWSHSHHWSGCPTWQLSRYALGLYSRFDNGQNNFDLTFYPGSLKTVEGKIPLAGDKQISVNWKRNNDVIEYEINTPEPIWINVPASLNSSQKGKIKVEKYLKLMIKTM